MYGQVAVEACWIVGWMTADHGGWCGWSLQASRIEDCRLWHFLWFACQKFKLPYSILAVFIPSTFLRTTL